MFKNISIALTLICALTAAASANVTVFERGLPTINLNNAAGADRSNVAWADSDYTTGWFVGDNFQLAGSGQTTVDDLTVWVVTNDEYANFTLWGGTGDVAQLRTSALGDADLGWTSVTYADTTTYQGSSGNFLPIYELTFKNLNWTVDNGTLYSFGVSSTNAAGDDLMTYLHASNAGLSGSLQDGADGSFYGFDNGALAYTWNTGVDGGWDKSSDINVRITAVPAPGAIVLGGLGVSLVGWLRRRRAL